jgi:TPR repeat protein
MKRYLSRILWGRRTLCTNEDAATLLKKTNALSVEYESGRDVTLLKQITNGYKKAASLGNAEAMYRLGRLYIMGWVRDDQDSQR